MIAILILALAGQAQAASGRWAKACEEIGRPDFRADTDDERPYFCSLPDRVKMNIPEVHWWPSERYQKWLRALPRDPAATLNLGKDARESHLKANAYVLAADACHFFSSISPSVQKNASYLKDPRTKIVLDAQDLLARCRDFGDAFAKDKQPLCSAIEFAGHATQSVGLDTVFGIDEKDGREVLTPSRNGLKEIGDCLRSISRPGAVVLFSTCGGDKEVGKDGALGPAHFWPGKESAQRELSKLMQMPIVSGIGFVDGTPEGGVTCDEGWHLSKP